MNSYKIYTKNDLQEVKTIWKEVHKDVTRPGLCNDWEWIETWLQIYGAVVDYHFFAGFTKNKPVGIALIVKETHRQFSKLIKTYHIGTSGEPLKDLVRITDNRLLVIEKEKPAFISELISYLKKAQKYEEIILSDYAGAESQTIIASLNKSKCNFSVKKEACYRVNLQNVHDQNELLDCFGRNVRHAFRRTLKDLGEDTHIEWAENAEQGLDILKDLVAFYEDKWVRRENRRSMFQSEIYYKFHKEIIKKLILQNKIMLTRLKCKKFGTLACAYFFIDNGIAYGYQVGQLDYAAFPAETLNIKKLKLGYVLHILSMQKCMEKGLRGYDHTGGNFRYKQELSTEQNDIVTISIKDSPKPYIRDFIVNTYTYLDNNKKLSKILWFLRKTLRV